jgi:hypothetical protein
MASKTAADGNGAAVAAADETIAQITVERIRRDRIEIPIVGLTPLIPHRWSEKAKRMMFEKQTGKATGRKPPKDPAKEAADATYWLPDGRPGIPATAFKAAIADAARYFDKAVTIENLKRVVCSVYGEVDNDGIPLVPIAGSPEMFEAMPRNSGGVADLRYRNKIWPWAARLEIEYVSTMITAEALTNIVDASGIGGVGDWRPSSPKSRSGTFGRYEVAA